MIVVGAGRPDTLDRFWNEAVGAQHRVDVDLGLGREARDRRAADVVDVVHEIAEQRQKPVALGGEQRRPCRIVVDNLDRVSCRQHG